MATEFRILGPLEAVVDGRPLGLGAPKQRALLAELLVNRGRVVPRSRLIDALWGEEAPEAAAASLQVYVHGLRRALGADRIETQGIGYRVRLEPGELDLERFEQLVERGSRALESGSPAAAAEDLRAALALRRGTPLGDLGEQPVAQAAAPYLEERCLEAVELRNDAELALGRHETLLPELEQLIREHPYRERLREQQMLALYRAGRQKEALDAYRVARRTLHNDLGVDPGPALQELERAVLRQAPHLAPPARAAAGVARLPRPPTKLVGRRLEVAAVTGLLRGEDARLVTLTGPGGTGKTRIALAAAEELAPGLELGAAFVDLAPLTEPDLVGPAIAQALRVPETADGLAAAVADHVGARSLLLVVDNFEQVLDAAPVVSSLLGAVPRLRVLATSREALRLYGEHEYLVPPLPVPPVDLPPFEEAVANDAVRLFTARARAVDPSFALTEANLADVATICRRLDGLPLAIELAAARTRLLAVRELALRLGQALDLLTEGARDLPPRQQALRSTLDWSYRLLPEPERALLARLAVFAGGLTLEAADVVVRDGDGVLDGVAALVDANLLRRLGDRGASTRYAMLETIRAYGLERLRAAGDEEEVARRHAEYFLATAEDAGERLSGAGYDDALATLDAEYDNLRTALVWASSSGAVEIEARLVAALRVYWSIRGHLREAHGFFQHAVDASAHADDSVRAHVRANGGAIAYRLGDVETARTWWEEALELYRRLDDADGSSRCIAELGGVAIVEGDLDRAVQLYLESSRLFEELGQRVRLAIAFSNLGAIESMRGDYEPSLRYAEHALELQRELGDADGTAVTLQNLARTRLTIGDMDEAAALLGECLELAGRLGYKEVLAYGLATAGELAHADGDSERSARLLGAGAALFDAIGVEMQGEEREGYERTTDALRSAIGGARLDELLAAGAALPVEDALREAVQRPASPSQRRQRKQRQQPAAGNGDAHQPTRAGRRAGQ
jgi:predicted ATPase/DNA-binding SARP family transcriptional activator